MVKLRIWFGLSMLLLWSNPAATQVVFLPDSHRTIAGTGVTNLPFGRSHSVRLQMGYDPGLFARPEVLTGVAFRLNEAVAVASKRVEFEMRLSTLPGGITGLQATFARNRGADESLVFARRWFDLPAVSARSPGAFSVFVPFDQSFSYDPAGGSLVLEVVVYAQDPGAYELDMASICDSVLQDYGPPGCGPGSRVLRVTSLTTQVTWGRPFVAQVFDAEALAPTLLLFGTREQGPYMGFQIPLDLTLFGAPGCSLSIDPLVTVGQLADATGTATFTLFVPTDPVLTGSWIRFQALALEPLANALGVITSRPTKAQICGWEPVARVFSAGLTTVTGQRDLGSAPVLRLTTQ